MMATDPLWIAALEDDAAWQVVADAVDAFERQWQMAGSDDDGPDLRPHVRTVPAELRELVLIELIKVDQEYRWQRNQRKPVEEYLREWPDLAARDAAVAELLQAECATQAYCDQETSVLHLRRAVSRRYPRLAADVDTHRTVRSVLRDCQQPSKPAERDAPQIAPRLQPGQEFAGMEIRKCLGEGGMGTVYLAYHHRLAREEALKIPKFDPATEEVVKQRFVEEARRAAQIKHENVCTIFDVGQADGILYIRMERIDGPTLAQVLDCGTLPPRKAAEIALRLTRALEAAHRQGVVHRDVKPGNVLVTRKGDPVLTDFGLARPTAAGDSTCDPQSPYCSGTPEYMAPELLRGEPADARCDIYGLGLVLYEMLTGGLPAWSTRAAAGQTRPAQEAACAELDAVCAGRDAALAGICARAIAPRPADRFQLATEMADALAAYLGAAPSRRRRRLPWLLVAAAGFVVAAAALVLRTGEGAAQIRIADANAQLWVDGQQIVLPPAPDWHAIPLKVGAHEVIVRKANREDAFQQVVIPWRGAKVRISIELDYLHLPVARQLVAEPRVADMMLSADNRVLYLAQSDYVAESGKPSTLQLLDLPSGRLLRTIRFGDSEEYDHKSLAVSSDGRFLYTTNYFRTELTRVQLTSGDAVTHLRIGDPDHPYGGRWANSLGITPDQRILAVVSGQTGRSVHDESKEHDTLSVISVADGDFALVDNVSLPDEAVGSRLAFHADSCFAYVVTRGLRVPHPELCEVSLKPPCQVTRRLELSGGELQNLAISLQLHRIFIADVGSNRVRVVNLETWQELASMTVDGHAPSGIAIDPPGQLLAVLCPESKRVFFLDAQDGTILGSTAGVRASVASFSQDSQQLVSAQSGGTGRIEVLDLRKLFAPRVLFASDRNGAGYQIFVMNVADRTPIALTDTPTSERYPRWSRDGRRIGFMTTRNGKPRIGIMDRNGQQLRVFEQTDPVALNVGSSSPFDWSPDGARIVFVGDAHRALRTLDIATGAVTTILDTPVGAGRFAHFNNVSWRPSDAAILFDAKDPSTTQAQGLFVWPPGGQPVELPRTWSANSTAWAPSASPNGAQIAFWAGSGDRPPHWRLCVVDADGNHPQSLVEQRSVQVTGPRWSSDGRLLVYSLGDPGDPDLQQVYCVDVETKVRTCLTEGSGSHVDADYWGVTPPVTGVAR